MSTNINWESWTVKVNGYNNKILLKRWNTSYGHLFQGKSIEISKEELYEISNYLKENWDWTLKSYTHKGQYISSSKFALREGKSFNISKYCRIIFDPYSKSLRIIRWKIVFDMCKSDADYIRKYGGQ